MFSKSKITAFLMLFLGIVVAGVVLGAGPSTIAIILGYFLPQELVRNIFLYFIPIAAVVAIIAASIFLKPKPLSPEELERFHSLKGETYDEVKELIGFNLRLGDRKAANEWAVKLQQFSKNQVEARLEKKN